MIEQARRAFTFTSLAQMLLIGVLIVMAGSLPARAESDTSTAVAPHGLKRAEIEAIVREYLLANPEILNEMVAKLQAKTAAAEAEEAQASINRHRDALNGETSSLQSVLGNPQGTTIWVEFSDYNCGYCKRFYPALMTVLKENPNIKLIVKEFPILAESSRDAARAALAASLQGKYDAYHEALMALQTPISDSELTRIAMQLNLDIDRWRRDLTSPEVEQDLATNWAIAEDIGLSGTPGLIVGDRLIRGFIPLDALRKLAASKS